MINIGVSIYCMKKRIIYFFYRGVRKYTSVFLGTEYGGFNVVVPKKQKKMVVYSFGVGEDLSFSKDMIERFNAEVYAFDPTPKAIKFVSENELCSNPKFHFYPYGLSDKNGREKFYLPVDDGYVSGSIIDHNELKAESIYVEMRSLKTIIRQLGHKKVDILKMDIEGSEFKVIENLDQEESSIIGEICMEIHERFFENPIVHLKKLLKCLKKKNFTIAHVGKELDVVTFVNKDMQWF